MMKKISIALAMLFALGTLSAQVVDEDGNLQTQSEKSLETKSADGRLQGWYVSGKNSLQFNQAAFSNWISGGINSYSFMGNLDYEFNLTKGKHIWDNRILLGYGILKNKGEGTRKSDDVIDLSTSYGYEIAKDWYLAAAANFTTQFSTGYDYDNQIDAANNKYPKISNFMAPGYLTLGLGIDYKPNENFQVNIHPLTSKMTFVTDKDMQYEGNFGLKNDGDSFLYELGAYLGLRYRMSLAENITFDNRVGVFSNYLKNPGNMVLAYQGILDMKVNDYISAMATINLFYDDKQISRMQIKETLGIGFAYNFNNEKKLKEMDINFPSVNEIQSEIDAKQGEIEKSNEAIEALEGKKVKAQSIESQINN